MAFYYIIFGILCFCGLGEYCGLKSSNKKVIYIALSLLFFVLSFIRWEFTGVGDWGNYLQYFTYIQWLGPYGSVGNFEWGYTFFNYMVGLFTDNYTILLFVLSIILYSFQSSAIAKQSPFPIISLLVLWSVQFGNIHYVRQWIAIAILLYSIKYLIERKWYFFLMLVIFAASFHRSAWLFLLAWWIWRIRLDYKTMIIVVLVSCIVSYLLGSVMVSLGPILGGVIEQKIALYTDESYNSATKEANNMSLIMLRGIPNKLFVFFLAIMANYRLKLSYPALQGYINLYWVGAILYFVFMPISLALMRFSYPFDVVQLFLIPYILLAVNKTANRLILFLILICYLALRLWQPLNGADAGAFVPYTTIFDL